MSFNNTNNSNTSNTGNLGNNANLPYSGTTLIPAGGSIPLASKNPIPSSQAAFGNSGTSSFGNNHGAWNNNNWQGGFMNVAPTTLYQGQPIGNYDPSFQYAQDHPYHYSRFSHNGKPLDRYQAGTSYPQDHPYSTLSRAGGIGSALSSGLGSGIGSGIGSGLGSGLGAGSTSSFGQNHGSWNNDRWEGGFMNAAPSTLWRGQPIGNYDPNFQYEQDHPYHWSRFSYNGKPLERYQAGTSYPQDHPYYSFSNRGLSSGMLNQSSTTYGTTQASGFQTQNWAATQQPIQGQVITQATIQETIYKPTIVEEVIRTDVITEVQPVITRHVEQPHIHHVQSHVYQAAPLPGNTNIVNAPIVNEVIHPRLINEVQEVVHKEVAVTRVNHVETQAEERLVLPTQHTREVIQGATTYSTSQQQTFVQGGQQSVYVQQPGLVQQTGSNVQMQRDSGMAQKLEGLAAATDRNRGMESASIDRATGEPVINRSSGLSAGLEKEAAKVERSFDQKHQTQAGGRSNFIA